MTALVKKGLFKVNKKRKVSIATQPNLWKQCLSGNESDIVRKKYVIMEEYIVLLNTITLFKVML